MYAKFFAINLFLIKLYICKSTVDAEVYINWDSNKDDLHADNS